MSGADGCRAAVAVDAPEPRPRRACPTNLRATRARAVRTSLSGVGMVRCHRRLAEGRVKQASVAATAARRPGSRGGPPGALPRSSDWRPARLDPAVPAGRCRQPFARSSALDRAAMPGARLAWGHPGPAPCFASASSIVCGNCAGTCADSTPETGESGLGATQTVQGTYWLRLARLAPVPHFVVGRSSVRVRSSAPVLPTASRVPPTTIPLAVRRSATSLVAPNWVSWRPAPQSARSRSSVDIIVFRAAVYGKRATRAGSNVTPSPGVSGAAT